MGPSSRRVTSLHRPRHPVENCYIERFNGKLRDECLNQHWFPSLVDAREDRELARGVHYRSPAQCERAQRACPIHTHGVCKTDAAGDSFTTHPTVSLELDSRAGERHTPTSCQFTSFHIENDVISSFVSALTGYPFMASGDITATDGHHSRCCRGSMYASTCRSATEYVPRAYRVQHQPLYGACPYLG